MSVRGLCGRHAATGLAVRVHGNLVSEFSRVTDLTKFTAIACLGGMGALSRYGLGSAVQRLVGPTFPLGTFLVNVVGCFGFGLLFALFEKRWLFDPEWRLVVLTGFLGAFTTFSTFAYESLGLLRDGQWLAAGANILGQLLLGLASVGGGLFLGRTL